MLYLLATQNILPMQKFLLCFLLYVFAGSTLSYGQVLISLLFGEKLNSDEIEFGLDGGLALNNFSDYDNTKTLNSFHLGFYFDFKIKEKWFLHTGVIVKSQMGAKNIPYYLDDEELNSLYSEATAKRKLNYFNVPVYAKYKFYNQFYAELGPQIGLLYKAKDEFDTKSESGKEISLKNDIKDNYKKLDFGLSAGLGYKLMKGTGINVGIRYYYGLVNIAKNNLPKHQNRVLYFYAGIPIGSGKNKLKN